MHLLPEEVLIKTGEVDHANWNYRPVLGHIQRLRFKLVRALLADSHYHRLLEIGYGSGIFMPELSRSCDELYGIDPHPHPDDVEKILSERNVTAKLKSGSAESIDHEDNFFDAVVAVSALEFIPDLDRACEEIRRVLKPDGVFVLVTPGHSPAADFGLKILTGKNPQEDFADRRQDILPILDRYFKVQKRLDYPPVIHRLVRIYTALRTSPK